VCDCCPLCHILFPGLQEEICLEDLQILVAAADLHMRTPNGSASPRRINHLCKRISNISHALRLWVYRLPSLPFLSFPFLSFPSQTQQHYLIMIPSNQMIRQQEIRNPLLDLILMATIPTHQTALTNLRL
jgi:hypothetical protein